MKSIVPATRDSSASCSSFVIGMHVVLADGRRIKAGGRVVKNVAGYDLMKLHIGALGTLGLVAEVNFKVQTRPEAEATVVGHFEAPAAAIEAEDGAWGLVEVYGEKGRRFKDEEVELAQDLAGEVGEILTQLERPK